ncbi:MAG: M12 family metallo-peptidase, partial [Phycisphaerales bacterium JB065]
TYRGQVAGQLGSTVAASVIEGRLEGTVWLEDGTELWFGNVSDRVMGAPHDLYAVYNADDVLDHGGTCGGGKENPNKNPNQGDRPDGNQAERGATIFTSRLGLDTDAEYYNEFGSTTLTQARMEAVINTLNVQYEDEVGITHRIAQVIIRTSTASQPYTSTNSDTLLDQFKDEWNANVDSLRSHAHLFSGKNFDGSTIGLAWVGVVCDDNFAYGISEANFSSNFSSITDLVAHELGHNWDADHCSCSSPPYTMNPSITGANTFNPTLTRPEIMAFRDGDAWGCNFFSNPVNNDHCDSATPISDGLTPFSTLGATTDGLGHSGCNPNQITGNDIWFTYTASATGELIVSTCEDLGASADYDTDIVVYNRSGAPCPPGDSFLLECNDDDPDNTCGTSAGGYHSTVRASVTAGQQLLIRVGGYSLSNEGSGQLLVEVRPANDDCSDAIAITSQLTSFSTVNATTDGLVHADCQYGGATGNDIWYTYTAPYAGQLIISTCEDEGGSADYDTDLVLYSRPGAPCPPTDSFLLACNDDDTFNPCGSQAGGYRSTIRYNASAGQQFLIRVGGFNDASAGSGQLLVKVAPINDNCEDAITITPGITPFSTLGANTDGVTHASCQFDGVTGRDIWYRFTAPCNGPLTISTCEDLGGSANYDTDLVLYSAAGAPCPPTEAFRVACNDDDPDNFCGTQAGGYHSTIVANVVAGQQYLIRVGGYNASNSGTGNLLVQCGSSCSGDLDGNGSIDLADLNLVLANFGGGTGGDANGDGNTDLADLNIVLAAFGTDC